MRFRPAFTKPSLGAAAQLCISRRAITTSHRQCHRWILVDKGIYIGPGPLLNKGLTRLRIVKVQGTSLDLNELKATTEQKRES
jgi:hypothetical protein